MRKLWEGRKPHLRDLAYMEELGSYNGTTLSLGLDPTSPSPSQRVITQEAAGVEKPWESYEKAMREYREATLGIWHPAWRPATIWHPAQDVARIPWISILPGS